MMLQQPARSPLRVGTEELESASGDELRFGDDAEQCNLVLRNHQRLGVATESAAGPAGVGEARKRGDVNLLR